MTPFKDIKVTLSVSTPNKIFVQEATVYLRQYISEEEWNKLNFFARQEFIEEEILNEWVDNYIEKSATVEG